MNRVSSKSSIFDDYDNPEGRPSLTRPKSNRQEDFQKEFVLESAPLHGQAMGNTKGGKNEMQVYFQKVNEHHTSSFTTQGTYGGAGTSLNY